MRTLVGDPSIEIQTIVKKGPQKTLTEKAIVVACDIVFWVYGIESWNASCRRIGSKPAFP